MTQPISRRHHTQGSVWSAPVVAASAAVPAYAASKETPGVQYGVYVSVQNNGGYVGYASSNNTGTINPATPSALHRLRHPRLRHQLGRRNLQAQERNLRQWRR